jgi:hypothetical protein
MRLIALLWLLFQPLIITAEAPLTVTLRAGAGPVDVQYSSPGSERLTITARSLAQTPIDVTLEILQGNTRLAFNDDHPGLADTELSANDAALMGLILSAPGVYTLRIHSFSGAQDGPVEVQVQAEPAVGPCPLAAVLELLAQQVIVCTLDAEAGQRITLRARDLSGTLDPALALLAPDGMLVAQNDDHASDDLTLNVLDAQIADFPVTETGRYTLRVRDFSGAAGTLELEFRVNEKAADTASG